MDLPEWFEESDNQNKKDYLKILWKNKSLTIADVKAIRDYYVELLDNHIASFENLKTPEELIDQMRFDDDIAEMKQVLEQKIFACNNWLHETLHNLLEDD